MMEAKFEKWATEGQGDKPVDGHHRCKRCGKHKPPKDFHIDDQGRQGKTCLKCKAANAKCSQQRRDKVMAERPQNTLPVNSGLSEEQLDERLATAVKKAVSGHNTGWTVRY